MLTPQPKSGKKRVFKLINQTSFFLNLVLVLSAINFFTTKKCRQESYSSCSEQYVKNKSLKDEKIEKLTFEISIWVKNGKLNFFNCVLTAQEVKFLKIRPDDAQRIFF